MPIKAINQKINKIVNTQGIDGFRAKLVKGDGYHYVEMEVLVNGLLKSFETESYYVHYTSHVSDRLWVQWVSEDIKKFVDNFKAKFS